MTRPTCGTHSGYNVHRNHGETPCDACRTANRDYHRAYYDRTRRRLIPSGEARAHIARLESEGHTLLAIAEAAHCRPEHLRRIARGEIPTLTPDVATRILNATPDPGIDPNRNRLIPATGTARRLTALRAMGWPIDHLAHRLGTTIQNVNAIERRRKRVTTRTAAAIAELYDEIAMRPGPSARAAKRARTLGAVVPLGWDDDTIDDPGAWAFDGLDSAPDDTLIDDVVVDRLVAGGDWQALGANRAERITAAERAARAGESLHAIERRLSLRAGRDFNRKADVA
jgi:plasmid maintenance system antidote protein VapI